MSRIAPKVRALALAIIAAAVFVLGAPVARAQPAEVTQAQVDAAKLAYTLKNYPLAAVLYGVMCQQGVAAACRNQQIVLTLLAAKPRDCGPSDCAQAVASPLTASATAERQGLAARYKAVENLTTPPTPAGCVQIDPVSYATLWTCERIGHAVYCAIARSEPGKGCLNGKNMYSETFGPGTAPDTQLFADLRRIPGGADIYWYECYGNVSQYDIVFEGPGVTAFDPKTGWRNVRCFDRNGGRTVPIYRTTLSQGGKGPLGR